MTVTEYRGCHGNASRQWWLTVTRYHGCHGINASRQWGLTVTRYHGCHGINASRQWCLTVPGNLYSDTKLISGSIDSMLEKFIHEMANVSFAKVSVFQQARGKVCDRFSSHCISAHCSSYVAQVVTYLALSGSLLMVYSPLVLSIVCPCSWSLVEWLDRFVLYSSSDWDWWEVKTGIGWEVKTGLVGGQDWDWWEVSLECHTYTAYSATGLMKVQQDFPDYAVWHLITEHQDEVLVQSAQLILLSTCSSHFRLCCMWPQELTECTWGMDWVYMGYDLMGAKHTNCNFCI